MSGQAVRRAVERTIKNISRFLTQSHPLTFIKIKNILPKKMQIQSFIAKK